MPVVYHALLKLTHNNAERLGVVKREVKRTGDRSMVGDGGGVYSKRDAR